VPGPQGREVQNEIVNRTAWLRDGSADRAYMHGQRKALLRWRTAIGLPISNATD